MPRAAGIRNRNYPSVALNEALKLARAIQDRASGMPVNRIILAGELNMSPGSSTYRDLLSASRGYGLTRGTEKADQISLTTLGQDTTGPDEIAAHVALRAAAMSPEPFRKFYTEFNNKRVPAPSVFKTWLLQQAGVPAEHADDAMNRILADARFVGLVRAVKGSEYVHIPSGTEVHIAADDEADDGGETTAPQAEDREHSTSDPQTDGTRAASNGERRATKVFIAHGKNRTPLEQLKTILQQLGVPIAVALDEPHAGRPISKKVADLMKQCSSAIFIFTADESVKGPDGTDAVRPSENVVFELGAAAVLYDSRIVIFKEEGVRLASDFSDLGHITFEKDKLDAKLGDLLKELVKFDILEIRAKA